MALTDTKLKSLLGKRRKSVKEYPDRDGLVIVAGLSGKLSWVFRYRLLGDQKRLTIGSYPAYSLTEAREKATTHRRTVEDGEDPKQELVKSEIVNIEHCRDEWLKKYVSTLAPKTQTLYESNASKYMTLSRFPYDVQTARFEQWISYFDSIAYDSSKVNSGHLLKAVKSMLRWCKRRGFIDDSLALRIELKAVGKSSEVGQRTLSLNEVAKVWIEVTRSKATPAIKNCVKLLILFGARNTEIREARISEFDLTEMIWTLPKERSKTKKILRRPIPRLAQEAIKELAMVYSGSDYLIPGAHKNTAMTTHSLNRFITRVWGKLHLSDQMDKFIPHDFRRTISTRLSERDVLPHVTEKMLGHELKGIMAVYNKHDWIDDQRKAYELWCDVIEQAIKHELSGA
jgi:integrase